MRKVSGMRVRVRVRAVVRSHGMNGLVGPGAGMRLEVAAARVPVPRANADRVRLGLAMAVDASVVTLVVSVRAAVAGVPTRRGRIGHFAVHLEYTFLRKEALRAAHDRRRG